MSFYQNKDKKSKKLAFCFRIINNGSNVQNIHMWMNKKKDNNLLNIPNLTLTSSILLRSIRTSDCSGCIHVYLYTHLWIYLSEYWTRRKWNGKNASCYYSCPSLPYIITKHFFIFSYNITKFILGTWYLLPFVSKRQTVNHQSLYFLFY